MNLAYKYRWVDSSGHGTEWEFVELPSDMSDDQIEEHMNWIERVDGIRHAPTWSGFEYHLTTLEDTLEDFPEPDEYRGLNDVDEFNERQIAEQSAEYFNEYKVQVERPGLGLITVCGLCGNTGIINTTSAIILTPYGARTPPIIKPCICPNGRASAKLTS